MIAFDNSFARLPEGFFARQAPAPVPDPHLVALNGALAARLGLDAGWLAGPEGVAMLAGNTLPKGAAPLAAVYAGHQFGGFSAQLGDGRAVLLGEVVAPDGGRFDLQLKGAGRTPFSRQGDGRAPLGPVLREYLVSEFMAAAGVPTTRALAAVTTGATVWRDTALPGAVLCRVAASHIRVGSFEYFAARGDTGRLDLLARYVAERHYPDADGALGLLRAVVARQADTIARWMALGFVHGVMNTDNMALSGETIDYGPCAFMDSYHPDAVFSSIDRFGRYRYSEQPQIAVWNLAQFASCLIPLMGPDQEEAVAAATEAVHRFPALYRAAWLHRFGDKLGLDLGNDPTLAEALLTLMADQGADFTRVFAGLADGTARDAFTNRAAFDAWAQGWRAWGPDAARMARANPRRIPRNHRVAQAILAAEAGDFAPFARLSEALCAPFEDRPDWADLATAPASDEVVTQTFCGT